MKTRDGAARIGQTLLGNEPVDLDERRGRAEKIATEERRKTLYDREIDDAAALSPSAGDDRPAPLDEAGGPLDEAEGPAGPMTPWTEAALKARHLLVQYAQTREGRIPAQSRLIEEAVRDLSDLLERIEDGDR